jgi:hypothetical protein
MSRKLFMVIWVIAVSGAVLNAQTLNETITIAGIQGVTAPASGRTPSRVIIENAQYSGTITWSPEVLGVFEPETQYTATITLAAKSGCTLQGVPANFFTVPGAEAVRNNANSGVVTAVFPATLGATVNIAAIQGVTAPVAGNTPVTEITETAQYNGTITWSPAVEENFEFGIQYTATISLTAKKGYTLQGVKANFFTVAGTESVKNAANSNVVTAVFPATTAAPLTINIAAIAGVKAPVTGRIPVTEITGNAQYSGTVTWSPDVSGDFEIDTTYTATITLIPKTGYTLKGVAADFFTVAGASASNNAESGVVTAAFPPTKERMTVHPEDAKLWTLGASLGTTFAAPLLIGTVHGTLAPFKYSFFELGMDVGWGGSFDNANYFSLYPFVNYALFVPFPRTERGKRWGWYAGAGVGVMIEHYEFAIAGPIWVDPFVAMNIVTGFSILGMFDISYTLRTNFKSADNKLALGYVYRFK